MKHLAHVLVGLVLACAVVPFALATPQQDPGTTVQRTVPWEYKVVGLTAIHESTLDYLKGALTDEGGLLGKAKAADEQLAKKTEDLLNELGAEGWDLVHYTNTSIILKRTGR